MEKFTKEIALATLSPKKKQALEKQAREEAERARRNRIFDTGKNLGQFSPTMSIPADVTEIWVFVLRRNVTYNGWYVIPVTNGKFETPELLRNSYEGNPTKITVRIPPKEQNS